MTILGLAQSGDTAKRLKGYSTFQNNAKMETWETKWEGCEDGFHRTDMV